MPTFQINYNVTAPVDYHPCGPRVRSVTALNHIEAMSKARAAYGVENADHIEITGVCTRDDDKFRTRLWHYLKPGYAWEGRRA